MQICVARMLQESGIFFAVCLPLYQPGRHHFDVRHDCSYCLSSELDLGKVSTLLMLRMGRQRVHLLYDS